MENRELYFEQKNYTLKLVGNDVYQDGDRAILLCLYFEFHNKSEYPLAFEDLDDLSIRTYQYDSQMYTSGSVNGTILQHNGYIKIEPSETVIVEDQYHLFDMTKEIVVEIKSDNDPNPARATVPLNPFQMEEYSEYRPLRYDDRTMELTFDKYSITQMADGTYELYISYNIDTKYELVNEYVGIFDVQIFQNGVQLHTDQETHISCNLGGGMTWKFKTHDLSDVEIEFYKPWSDVMIGKQILKIDENPLKVETDEYIVKYVGHNIYNYRYFVADFELINKTDHFINIENILVDCEFKQNNRNIEKSKEKFGIDLRDVKRIQSESTIRFTYAIPFSDCTVGEDIEILLVDNKGEIIDEKSFAIDIPEYLNDDDYYDDDYSYSDDDDDDYYDDDDSYDDDDDDDEYSCNSYDYDAETLSYIEEREDYMMAMGENPWDFDSYFDDDDNDY